MPARPRRWRRFKVNLSLVSGDLSLKWKRRPRLLPRIARKFRRAVTGHRVWFVRPKWILTPWRNGSVLEHLRSIRTMLGAAALSRAISAKLRCTCGSYAARLGIVSSPARMKPKKQTRKAAHNIMLSKSCGCSSKISRI